MSPRSITVCRMVFFFGRACLVTFGCFLTADGRVGVTMDGDDSASVQAAAPRPPDRRCMVANNFDTLASSETTSVRCAPSSI